MAKRSDTTFYSALGLNSSATPDEIRRAYRVLARRYHPDLNPDRQSEEKFKVIAEAYRVLGDPVRRKQYDLEVELNIHGAPFGHGSSNGSNRAKARRAAEETSGGSEQQGAFGGRGKRDAGRGTHQGNQHWSSTNAGFDHYSKGAAKVKSGRETLFPRKPSLSVFLAPIGEAIRGSFEVAREIFLGLFTTGKVSSSSQSVGGPAGASETKRGSNGPASSPSRLSIIEVSISIQDSLRGVRKSVEVEEPEGIRKISVQIPAGVRNGSVVRMRGKSGNEELILIMRLAQHPYLSIHLRGLVIELPITPAEAINGANVSVPTLEDPVLVKIPPGAQSGQEIRVRGKGILDSRSGERGDLFVRLMIRVPECIDAYGIKDKAGELDKYFERGVRAGMPSTLDQA